MFFNLLAQLPVPSWLRSLMYVMIVVANYLCALAGMTSTSRMVFAFGRDGGLPGSKLWRYVSPTYRTPVPAIWLVAVLSCAVTLYSSAFAALAAGCAIFLYVSYAMPIDPSHRAGGNGDGAARSTGIKDRHYGQPVITAFDARKDGSLL